MMIINETLKPKLTQDWFFGCLWREPLSNKSRAFAIVCEENHLQTKAICELGTLSQENQLQTKAICEVGTLSQENHLQTKEICEVGLFSIVSQENHLQTKEICEVGFFFFCFSRKTPSNKSNKWSQVFWTFKQKSNKQVNFSWVSQEKPPSNKWNM